GIAAGHVVGSGVDWCGESGKLSSGVPTGRGRAFCFYPALNAPGYYRAPLGGAVVLLSARLM
ncbi:MAG: hypothetical protein WAM04_11460, partial [Candidatus Sulfotelmatobacter sp.]